MLALRNAPLVGRFRGKCLDDKLWLVRIRSFCCSKYFYPSVICLGYLFIIISTINGFLYSRFVFYAYMLGAYFVYIKRVRKLI